MPREKIVGILGGMGPDATVDLMRRIIRNTPVNDDVDHIRCIIDNNPKVPSRIKALSEEGGESPVPCLTEMARRLEHFGADILAIACTTAHSFLGEIQSSVSIPIVNMIDLAVAAVDECCPGARKAGVMAMPAVRGARLYTDCLAGAGIEAVYPDPYAEALLFDCIQGVKRGERGRESKEALSVVMRHLRDRGVDVFIVACAELVDIIEEHDIPIVDATEALAKGIVREVKGPFFHSS